MEEVEMPFYMRFSAVDRPGVLSTISGILGKNGISIASVIQKGRQINGAVPVVMMTHEAREENVHRALKEIDRLKAILGKTMYIRVENELESVQVISKKLILSPITGLNSMDKTN
jgi:homoserine dehydrogenase